MASSQEPQRVSAADFIRGFANWRLQAARKPVVVTHHGKDAHVLISLDDYRRMDAETASDIAAASNALQRSLANLIESIRDGVILIDKGWRIAAINPAAVDMVGVAAADLIGTDLMAILPGLEASLLSHRLTRLLDHRERFSGDIPDLLRPRQWLRIDLAPVPTGGAIILRDVTDTMDDCAIGDARRALQTALDTDGGVGHVRLSVREVIEDANDALLMMVGAAPHAIRRVRFSALLAVGHRQAFVAAFEATLRDGEPMRLDAEIVTREGAVVAVTLSVAPIRGAYANEGAMVIVTRRLST